MTREQVLSQRLLLCLALGWIGPIQSASPACPDADKVIALQLQGQWQVQLKAQTQAWRLELKPHPEHIGSLRGTLDTGTQRFAVVADWDDGEFTLEESHDGQRIAATWLGKLKPNSCAKALTGQRETAQGVMDFFEMRRFRAE
jgi:hypothetical protein